MSTMFHRRTQSTDAVSLPAEILAEIFKLARAAPRVESQVCRLWRHVTLGSPQLWTDTIDYEHDHPDFVREQLRRSANMPVLVKAHFPMHSNRGIHNLHLALKESAVHTLDFQGPPQILEEVWQNLDATFLQTLSLFVPWDQVPKTTPYPGPSFELNAPLLRALSLSNFVAWDAPIFNNLTHLRLHLQDPTFAPSMTQILEMVASSPMLTELSLLHAIETSSRLPGHESIGVVPLPHLAAFLLDDDILNHIFLLRHIEIPAHCARTLKVEHRGQNALAELSRSISASLPLSELTRLVLESDPSRVTARGYTATTPSSPLIQITLRCAEGYSQTETASVAGTLTGSLPLAAATSLELIFRDPRSATIPVEAWETCLQNLNAVEYLQVKPTTPPNLLAALGEPRNGAPVPLLPRLQRLGVHHPDSSPASSSHESARPKPAGNLGSWWQKIEIAEVTFLDTLLTCLEGRQQLGAKLGSLRIARCVQCPAQMMQRLTSVVNDVSCGPT